MKTFAIIIAWFLSIVLLVHCQRAEASDVGHYNEFMAYQIQSVYLERSNYIHEVDMGLVEYNPEMDKSLGIQIDLLCNAWGRTSKQCWYQMLFETGAEARVYRSW